MSMILKLGLLVLLGTVLVKTLVALIKLIYDVVAINININKSDCPKHHDFVFNKKDEET